MHHDDNPACHPTPAEDDAMVEGAVLNNVLAVYPDRLTMDEALREMIGRPEDFAERDAVERAVQVLTGVGLLRRNGEEILPTRTALYFSRLVSG